MIFNQFWTVYIYSMLFMLGSCSVFLFKSYKEDKKIRDDFINGKRMEYTSAFTIGDVILSLFLIFVPIVNASASFYLFFTAVVRLLKPVLSCPILGSVKK